MNFYKYHAVGNNFILIDDRKLLFNKKKIKQLCKNDIGIGADGLILLQNSSIADFKMQFFNNDGKEADCCGNGLCCLLQFIKQLKLLNKKASIETKKEIIEGSIDKTKSIIIFNKIKIDKENFSFPIGKEKLLIHQIFCGVPHVVIFFDTTKSVTSMRSLAKKIRFHPMFFPNGVNVNFVKIKNGKELKIKTYEKGVEDFTNGCGTGAVSTAMAYNLLNKTNNDINILFKHGTIKVQILNASTALMETQAHLIIKGKYY